MAISALGEANVDMQAKIKVGAVEEKCQVSGRTGGWGLHRWSQRIEVLAVGRRGRTRKGLSWAFVPFFSHGNAVLPQQVAELSGPLCLAPPWLFMLLKAQLQPP